MTEPESARERASSLVAVATLYQVELATGATTSLGKIGGPKTLIDIAAAA